MDFMSPFTVSLRTLGFIVLLTAVIVFLLTLWLGHAMFSPAPMPASTETIRMGSVQEDGSVKAPRVPVAAPNLPPAPHIIPNGSVEKRRISVTVKPNPPIRDIPPLRPDASGMCPVPNTLVCPPVTVNLSLIEDSDRGHSVIASSPDGTVVESIDIPIFDFREPPTPNAVHVFGNTSQNVYSASYTRTLTLFRKKVDVGAAVFHTDTGEIVPMAGGGFRF